MDVIAHQSVPARRLGTRRELRGWSLATLIANIGIIVTGAIVRLTDSGLGCPTWPECTDASYVPHNAVGHHAAIEFGNRTLTFVLIVITICTLIVAIRSHASRTEKTLAWVIAIGIPFQGVIGGITVLTHLNPWVVSLHLLFSVALVVISTCLLISVRDTASTAVPRRLRVVVHATFWVLMIAVWFGTVVTGAGPHSGSIGARRNNLDIETVARVHAETVWVGVALTVVVLIWASRLGLRAVRRSAVWLVAVELLQGAIGYTQYFMGLPTGLVVCHLLGMGLVVVAVSWLWRTTRTA